MYDMSNWSFSLATPEDLQPYFDPSLLNDPGFTYTPGVGMVPDFSSFGQSGGMGVNPSQGVSVPSFTPMSAPSQAGAPQIEPVSAPAPSSGGNAAPVLGGAPGAGDRGGPATTTPGSSGSGSILTNGGRGWTPGSQQTNIMPPQADHQHAAAPAPPGTQGDSFWSSAGKNLMKAAMSSGTQALVGGGLSLLGNALAPQPSQPKPYTPMSAGPAPAPTTPTGTPTAAPSAPRPGAQWSPLLMGSTPKVQNGTLGLEAERRMRRGRNTGGMALY